VLDWSVNDSHGTASDAAASRELARIQEKAELLDGSDEHRR